MAADVVETVKQCYDCTRNSFNLTKRTKLKLFPENAHLQSVKMDILGKLPKIRHGNQFLLVIADRYSKFSRTMPMRTTTALAVAEAFLKTECTSTVLLSAF